MAGLLAGVLAPLWSRPRRGAVWGKVLVAIAVLFLAGIALYRGLSQGGPASAQQQRRFGTSRSDCRTCTDQDKLKLLGESFKDYIAPGSRIFILGYYRVEGGRDVTQAMRAWEEGLSEGLGDTSWERVGYYGPADGTAERVSSWLQGAVGEIDAVVSVAGLPADLEAMTIYQMSPTPKVAAVFEKRSTDIVAIRRWLEEGYLQVAVVESDGGDKVYTPENLP